MHIGKILLGAVLTASLASPSTAATGQGLYSGALKRMLVETATGTCPADIMADKLLAACREQLPRLRPQLAAAGAVTSLVFVKAVDGKGGRVEQYKVTFAKGAPADWYIGMQQSGKFQTAYSPG